MSIEFFVQVRKIVIVGAITIVLMLGLIALSVYKATT